MGSPNFLPGLAHCINVSFWDIKYDWALFKVSFLQVMHKRILKSLLVLQIAVAIAISAGCHKS